MAMGIECFRVQFPKGMDANEYALKVTPAAKSLAVLLNNAIWLGKGKRPTVAVSEPQSIEEKSEPAAKEKIAETSETIEANTQEESVLPLTAESEAAPMSVPVAPSPLEAPLEKTPLWASCG